MAFTQIAPTIKDEYKIKQFVIDTDADISALPECGAGSTAISVSSGKVFMVNASREWKELGGE